MGFALGHTSLFSIAFPIAYLYRQIEEIFP
jgi:hypothetical protein